MGMHAAEQDWSLKMLIYTVCNDLDYSTEYTGMTGKR